MRFQDKYYERIFDQYLKLQGQRLTYTHFTSKVNWNSMIEITFNRWGVPFARFSALSDGCFSRSVKISKNKVYRIGMVLNKVRKDGNNTLKVWIIDHCNFPGWLVPDGCVHPQSQLWRILFHFLRWATQRYAQGRPYKVRRFITSLCFNFCNFF